MFESYDHEVIVKAITFAAKKHKGMVRKKTDIPYIVHPMEATAIAATMTSDPNVIAAAVLHDVIEDTGTSLEELSKKFNETICRLVAQESEKKGPKGTEKETWKQRKQETIDSLGDEDNLNVKIIALADKLSNIRAIHRDLNNPEIGETLWSRFNQKDPKMQGWYYYSMIGALKDLEQFDAWKEYKRLVEEVFVRYCYE